MSLTQQIRVGPAFHALCGLRSERGRRWGDEAHEYQRRDAATILGHPQDTRPYTYVTRGRGGAKSSDLAGMLVALTATEAPPRAQLDIFAADRAQARIVLEYGIGWIERNPELQSLLKIQQHTITNRLNGAAMEVHAADASGAYGRRPWRLLFDEFGQWATTPRYEQIFEAAFSGAAKTPGARVIVTTTASSPSHPSYRLLKQAEASDNWTVLATPGPTPWLDPAAIAEQRATLTESAYARLIMNQWTEGAETLISVEDIDATMVGEVPTEPEPGAYYVGALDLGLVSDWTIATILHQDSEGVAVVDDLVRWKGDRGNPVALDDVASEIVAMTQRFGRVSWTFDAWQSELLAQQLRRQGIPVETVQFTSGLNHEIATALVNRLRDRTIVLPWDEVLRDELYNVRVVETNVPNQVKLDHAREKHNDHSIAIGLALTRLATAIPSSIWSPVASSSGASHRTPQQSAQIRRDLHARALSRRQYG